MKVKDLIKQLEELNKPDAEIVLLGNVGHPEDEETDLYFDNVEVWNDGEDSITLFVGLNDETLEQIESQKPKSNDDIDDEDYQSGLLYGVDNNQ
jgi:4-hydroxy-3-methylbut-2-enyl diphosphate reductase IspH